MFTISIKGLEFGHFTLLFYRERQRNGPKCNTHVQLIVLLYQNLLFSDVFVAVAVAILSWD